VTDADAFAGFLAATRARVDAALDRWLPRPPACPSILCDAMRYSVLAGGKRLRPILTLAAADAAQRTRMDSSAARATEGQLDPVALALPAACAVELIHTYSLIHDDLPAMDNDTLRRGQPTLHVLYGDGIAILAGDGLQAEAFALLAREPPGDEGSIMARKLRTARLIAEAAGPAGMVGGQAVDLQAAGQAAGHAITLDGEGLRDMHARKTGALITASAASGAVMAGGPDDVVAAVSQYAAHLGIAFQIIDDVLDVEGDQATLGKTAGKDVASDKLTYPVLFGVERSRALAADSIDQARSALEHAQLMDNWLWPIAQWMLGRSH
jgi:geranylgeranyl pyrophosphate synthase